MNCFIGKDCNESTLFINLDFVIKIETVVDEEKEEGYGIIYLVGGLTHRIELEDFNRFIKSVEEKEQLLKSTRKIINE